MSHVKQELHTLPEHQSSPPILREGRVLNNQFSCSGIATIVCLCVLFIISALYCLFLELRLMFISLVSLKVSCIKYISS